MQIIENLKVKEKLYIEKNNETRGEKKKNGFKIKKENTIKSLKEVECFLWNWKKACKGICLYKFLK